jgi:PKD repeat protein
MAFFPPASTCGSPPAANFSLLEAALAVGQPITILNLSTGTGPFTYAWGFGDGSPVSSEVNPARAYSDVGDYTVTLSQIRRRVRCLCYTSFAM